MKMRSCDEEGPPTTFTYPGLVGLNPFINLDIKSVPLLKVTHLEAEHLKQLQQLQQHHLVGHKMTNSMHHPSLHIEGTSRAMLASCMTRRYAGVLRTSNGMKYVARCCELSNLLI